MPYSQDSVDFPAGEIRETVPVFSGEADFIPLVEFEREIRFFKETGAVLISVFATGDILVRLKGTDITAEAHSIEEAIDALKLEIEEEYFFLKENHGHVSGHLKKQFDIINRFF